MQPGRRIICAQCVGAQECQWVSTSEDVKTGDLLVRLEHHGEEITHRVPRQDRLRDPGVPYPDLKAFEKPDA